MSDYRYAYDWKRLPVYWAYEKRTSRLVCTHPQGILDKVFSFDVKELEGPAPENRSADYEAARAVLAGARVSKESFQWKSLEGTGWRHGGYNQFITNGKFNYWYSVGPRPQLEALDMFHATEAMEAEKSAVAALKLCRREREPGGKCQYEFCEYCGNRDPAASDHCCMCGYTHEHVGDPEACFGGLRSTGGSRYTQQDEEFWDIKG